MVRTHMLEHNRHMLEVFDPCRVVDQDVVKENEHKLLNVGLQDLIHQRLKCG
jgi:hypothetical protein